MGGRVKPRKHALTASPVHGKPTDPKVNMRESTTLIKTDLGTKRVCPSCAARFYDLQKRPIECPKCAFSFEPEMLLKQRRTRVPEPAKAAVVQTEDDEQEETEDEEVEEEAGTEDEELEEEEAVPAADEPLAEVEGEEEGEDGEPAAPEEPAEPEEFEEEIEDEEEEDDNLLEEVEEDEDDVSGIIDADIEKDEP
jgi:uncharacterized protein (TIGR02300 family)